MERLLWYLIAGTRGGYTRGKIIMALKDRPRNVNQLAELLGLDYRAVKYHIDVLLEDNILIVTKKGKYGALYFLSNIMKENYQLFQQIWKKVGGDVEKNK